MQNEDSKSTFRTAVEITGVILAALLVLAMITNMRSVGMVTIVVFAIVGAFAVFNELRQSAKPQVPPTASYVMPLADPGAPGIPDQSQAVVQSLQPPARKSGMNLLAKVGIWILILIAAVYVLPFVAMLLFIMFVLVVGGGDVGT